METIIVDNNGCNDRSFTVLNLTRFVNLKVFEVGDYSFSWVPVQPSRKGGRRFPVSLLLLDAVCYDEQLLLRDTHPQRAPCREKDESVLSLYIAIYRPNL